MMLQTGNYRVSTDFVVGNKGAPIDEARAMAMRNLAINPNNIETNCFHIRRAIFDTEVITLPMFNPIGNLPSPLALEKMSLNQAKTVCLQYTETATAASAEIARPLRSANAEPEIAPVGVMWSVDGARDPASAMCAARGQAANLDVHTIFNKRQLTDACGYNSAAWALMARARSEDFHVITEAETNFVHNHNFILNMNRALNIFTPIDQSPAIRLTVDQIHHIAATYNPDGAGQPANWLTVGALNHFEEYFDSTLINTNMHGITHIMIVNNVRQAALVNAYAGDHWFVVVWRIFPRSSGGPSVVP